MGTPVSPTNLTVLYSWTEDKTNLFYPVLHQQLDELKDATTESGKPLTLVCLPKPENEMYSTLPRPPARRLRVSFP